MHIFEYPYIIITILVFGFLIMGAIGVYFVIKGIHASNVSEELSFTNVSRLMSSFSGAGSQRKNRSLIYIEITTDTMSRLYSQTKAAKLLAKIRKSLLKHFYGDNKGIAVYGKNFVAVNECSAERTEAIIKNALCEVNDFILKDGAVNIVKVYFGYCSTKSTEVTFDMALGRAKQACTLAENKNISYCEWDVVNGRELEKKIKFENTIQSEIDNNRFFLEYQPIIDAVSNKTIGAEVLARLNSSDDGIITPGTFLSAVNSVGLNKKFDYYIFEKNCKWISNNKLQREKYVYTINFSRATLCDKDFSDMITAIVNKYELSFSSLAVEILEDKNLTDSERDIMAENIMRLKENGILILLDDFGSGYTSFADLGKFKIDILKIDKKITKEATDKTGFVIFKNIIQTAKDLGFRTLCEGIETEEQRLAVTKAGCDMVQGYYFSRPVPVAQLEELLEDNK